MCCSLWTVRGWCPATVPHTRHLRCCVLLECEHPDFAPANYAELRYWLTYLVRKAHGPRMIRYARGGENPALAALPCTGARYDVLDPVDGARIALVSYGAETEEIIAAKDLLAQHGVQADCVKLTQLYPLPDGVCDTLKHYDTILFAEDTVRTGGIGEQLGFAMQQCAGRANSCCIP